MRLFTLLMSSFLLLACSSQQLSDYQDKQPTLDLQAFFTGELEASGIVIGPTGKVTRTFTVELLGTWQNNQGVLEEWFVFDDGEKTTRTWRINDLGNGQYTGTAGDIIGTAEGASTGNALKWVYDLEIEVDGSVYQVKFDDWMYQVSDTEIINKSKIKKWGFNVGEVILSIRKK
ncbi:DUF3833 domain-containing protein [Motilimonas cestriensis]|uniref:DUF3833 domain-containing protein n=1 Tax=Motilimonas cestriensis TaxID=2742685 RepID=A0ABS8WDE6_9GAMM|nr:DUF3833 domain-containing protein [Motilimonas cestriensis]MCE2597069.1 DUF3833 domain-containing protein [Motilimonas cestriensis]